MLKVTFEISGMLPEEVQKQMEYLLNKEGYKFSNLVVEPILPEKLHQYGMRLKPFGVGAQPKGYFKSQTADKCRTGYWSYVWYAEELSEEDMKKYGLEYLGLQNMRWEKKV